MQVDNSWTLFLDRDGVINEKRENDYVKNWDEFIFLDGALEAISKLSTLFGYIIIVTNQRGVGKGVMSELELESIHNRMTKAIFQSYGRIDKIYFCTDVFDSSENRKPNIGMANKARKDFPNIDFNKSIIVGDSISDMLFGEQLGMLKVLVNSDLKSINSFKQFDFYFQSLFSFSNYIVNNKILNTKGGL